MWLLCNLYNRLFPLLLKRGAGHNELILGQCKSDGKSNEMTSIPLLLEILAIEGCVVTIDAMVTQRKIAGDIVKGGANYILILKGNPQNVREKTESIFRVQKSDSTNETTEKGHGRIETRKCEVISILEFLYGKEKWKKESLKVYSVLEKELRKIERDSAKH